MKAMIHGVCHAESYAIDLMWDSVARFALGDGEGGAAPPEAFFDEWVQIACEEARHFSAWAEHLKDRYAISYGDLPTHDMLWEVAAATKHSLRARLAVVHLIHEARGLDVAPAMRARCVRAQDMKAVEILDRNVVQEVGHVRAGVRWFIHLSRSLADADPQEEFLRLARTFVNPGSYVVKRPLNSELRLKAELPESWYLPLAEDEPQDQPSEEPDESVQGEEAFYYRTLRGRCMADYMAMNEAGSPEDPFGAVAAAPPLILRCKIVLLGDPASGKTSLAQVFQGGVQNFPKNYNMTIGIDFMVKRVGIPDTNVVVEMYIVDCGGFSICQDLLKPHWENANAVMMVYDASNPESFNNLEAWYRQLKQSRGESAISGVVIASKTDLADRPGAVSSQHGQQFSSEKGLEFFETCATKGIVDAPFHFLAEVFYQKYGDRKAELENLH
ncbi:unnamed protein product [Polarella glacialis]|uniref:Uncharacterized protein n=1 Tax=Polarella glacialis TaxID=89957 RepID=A0A813GZU9_POLGL|nr:unnamed protein product [Polarella glacialis]